MPKSDLISVPQNAHPLFIALKNQFKYRIRKYNENTIDAQLIEFGIQWYFQMAIDPYFDTNELPFAS